MDDEQTKEIINNEIYNFIACFIVHLSGTHGIPKQIFDKWFLENEHYKIKYLFAYIDKRHKDFLKYYFKRKDFRDEHNSSI